MHGRPLVGGHHVLFDRHACSTSAVFPVDLCACCGLGSLQAGAGEKAMERSALAVPHCARGNGAMRIRTSR